jgi:hypothetical protein
MIGKGKLQPRTGHKGRRRNIQLSSFFNLGAILVWVVNAMPPAVLPPGKRPGTHCIGGWVGPRAGVNGCGKSLPPPGFDPRTFQPAASPYNDHALVILTKYKPGREIKLKRWEGNMKRTRGKDICPLNFGRET